jgi:hypothetical protein
MVCPAKRKNTMIAFLQILLGTGFLAAGLPRAAQDGLIGPLIGIMASFGGVIMILKGINRILRAWKS